ncbi:MAG: hypothetical protein E6G75_20260 [Alphaproteobacteria bacterium]|nr:MAG: hypothetical protein E6G75_20260 [Alphaproteobacteria bacterium]
MLRAGHRIAPKPPVASLKQGRERDRKSTAAEPVGKNGISSPRLPGGDRPMGRYLLLWLLGVPIPILILSWALGGLH